MILGFGNATCPFVDPFPGCGLGSVMLPLRPGLRRPAAARSRRTRPRRDARRPSPPHSADAGAHRLRSPRTDAGSFIADGFVVGHAGADQRHRRPSTRSDRSPRTVLTLQDAALQPTVTLNAAASQVWHAPLLHRHRLRRRPRRRRSASAATRSRSATAASITRSAVRAWRATWTPSPGPTRRSSSTATRRRTASGTAGHPDDVLGYEFGPKPFDPFTQIPDAENEDDEWVFPLANPYDYAGNDVIDAQRPVRATVAPRPTLPTRRLHGLRRRRQRPDHRQPGRRPPRGRLGRRQILGLRGVDHIYGDSGVNVDILTRGARRSTTDERSARGRRSRRAGFLNNGTTIEPAPVAGRRRRCDAGRDLIYGEGAGTDRRRPAERPTTTSSSATTARSSSRSPTRTSPTRACRRSRRRCSPRSAAIESRASRTAATTSSSATSAAT